MSAQPSSLAPAVGVDAADAALPSVVPALVDEAGRLRRRYPPGFESSLVLPLLRRVQEIRGWIAEPDVEALAALLAVPRIQIDECLSFYTQFRRAPVGRLHLQVCRNVSCSLRGAERLLAHLAERHGLREGDVRADASVSLATCECLGSCGTAPVVLVNDRYHEAMTVERLDALLQGGAP